MKKSKILACQSTIIAQILENLSILKTPHKADILKELARNQLCSPKSTGSEKTFMRRAQELGFSIPPALSNLMRIKEISDQEISDQAQAQAHQAPASRQLINMDQLTTAEKSETGLLIRFANGGSLQAHGDLERSLRDATLMAFAVSVPE